VVSGLRSTIAVGGPGLSAGRVDAGGRRSSLQSERGACAFLDSKELDRRSRRAH
jgi:hypothetical protein